MVSRAGHGDDVVKLYDLTTLCDLDSGGDGDGGGARGAPGASGARGQDNPFTVPVGVLLYRVARNMLHSSSRRRGNDATIRTLLKNCLLLLDSRAHPQVGGGRGRGREGGGQAEGGSEATRCHDTHAAEELPAATRQPRPPAGRERRGRGRRREVGGEGPGGGHGARGRGWGHMGARERVRGQAEGVRRGRAITLKVLGRRPPT